ncbi:MAG: DUF58 domain-containing protein [Microthrixaceae bacterium]|nr:DUF58 domain-containing protein [Microthrixaceae bacterium]
MGNTARSWVRNAGDRSGTPGRVRPTAFGATLLVALVAAVVLRPGVVDREAAAMVLVAVGALLVVGVAMPLVALRSLTVELEPLVTELDVAQVMRLRCTVFGSAGVGPLRVRVASVGEPVPLALTAQSELQFPAPKRGRFETLEVEVVTEGPIGVVRLARRFEVTLPRPLIVGPEVVAAQLPWQDLVVGTESSSSRQDEDGAVRAVRPYQFGDTISRVHWRATARRGDVLVREYESEAHRRVTLAVDLGACDDPEAVASLAAGLALDGLRRGAHVVLAVNDGRPHSTEVRSAVEVRRALAVARVGEVSPTSGGLVIDVARAIASPPPDGAQR